MRFKHPQFIMAYEDQGAGIPLLLIHGYPLNRRIWQLQFEGLSDIVRVIAPDLRGHGDSSPVADAYPMELLARDCAALLDHLSINQPVVVCGLSMGGYIAMALCRLFVNRLVGLILVSTRGGADSVDAQVQRRNVINAVIANGIQPVVNSMTQKLLAPHSYQNNPALVAQLKSIISMTSTEGIIGAQLGMIDRPDSHATLKKLTIPALVIHGREDQIVPVSEAEMMNLELRNSRLVIIPEAGHLPNLEQPAIFNQTVREFLKELTDNQT